MRVVYVFFKKIRFEHQILVPNLMILTDEYMMKLMDVYENTKEKSVGPVTTPAIKYIVL